MIIFSEPILEREMSRTVPESRIFQIEFPGDSAAEHVVGIGGDQLLLQGLEYPVGYALSDYSMP